MSDKIRIGIIGVGQIGKHHVQRYKDVPEAEIVAICDIREDEAQRVAQTIGSPTIYSDYRDLLARDDIQSVDVCLHNHLHAPVTIAALEAGKDVYCEKPMSWNYSAAKSMLAAAKRGLKPKDPKNNTWTLEPADEISVGSALQKTADRAKMYLERVIKDHEGTPWAMLAAAELKDPLGWRWKESFTDVSPMREGAGNGNAPAPANDARMMLQKGPPKRPAPKL
jgi:hypothetical protein